MNKVLAVNLYNALKQVKRTKMHTLPVLNHALLQFREGELVITSTDLNDTLRAKCSCILNEEWETCVNMITWWEDKNWDRINKRWKKESHKYYPFLDFAKIHAEYNDVLEFTFNYTIQTMTIKVQGERSIAEFKCLDAQEFPSVAHQLVGAL